MTVVAVSRKFRRGAWRGFPTGLALAAMAAALSTGTPAHAQEPGPWKGLTIPDYPNATEASVERDDDEYTIRFRSPDRPRATFDFYRAYLEKQGFQVVQRTTKRDGFEADLVRTRGGVREDVELEATVKDGRHEVEIELD